MVRRPLSSIIALIVSAVVGGAASAEQIRILYCPQDSGPTTVMKAADPGKPTGVRVSGFGLRREPYYCLPKSNCLRTFCHTCTKQNVTLPLYLPAATPRVAHTWRGISYQYTGFAVNVNFLQDGSVEVVYDNGPY
jgi:hypothetical protein